MNKINVNNSATKDTKSEDGVFDGCDLRYGNVDKDTDGGGK